MTTDSHRLDGDFFESFGDNSNIMYSDIDHVERCFNMTTTCSVLVTHNGDRPVTEELYQKFKSCKKYKVWFAQNICCKHDDLICLPIGLERRRWCKFDKLSIIEDCLKNYDGSKANILYANFSLGTKLSKRVECINTFNRKTYLTNLTQQYTPNVRDLSIEQYRRYCNDILQHKFVLCPEGNGIDTHRLWETLYLGRIPVVLHNHVNDSFADMPILILDRWEDFENHIDDNITGSLEKLTTTYWQKEIKGIV